MRSNPLINLRSLSSSTKPKKLKLKGSIKEKVIDILKEFRPVLIAKEWRKRTPWSKNVPKIYNNFKNRSNLNFKNVKKSKKNIPISKTSRTDLAPKHQ